MLSTMGGEKIRGKVSDAATGAELPGVLVTNCDQVTRTDEKGEYCLPRNPKTRFVTVMVPADRKAKGFQARVTADRDIYDFSLAPQPVETEFSFVHIADTENESAPEMPGIVDKFRVFAKHNRASFVLHSGDIHTPEDIQWYGENVTPEKWGIDLFFTIGNHDHNDKNKNSLAFEENIGSMSYAFQRGNVTFIALPFYGDYSTPADLTQEDICRFLHNILQELPKDQPIMLLSHYPENISADGIVGKGSEFEVDLKQWNIKAWFCGHDHRTQSLRNHGISLLVSATSSRGVPGEAAGFRFHKIDAEGNVKSVFVNTFNDKKLSAHISPLAEDGSRTAAIAVEDAGSLPLEVSLSCKDNAAGKEIRIAAERVYGSLWTCQLPSEMGNGSSVKVQAEMSSGETLESEAGELISLPEMTLKAIRCLKGNFVHGSPVAGGGKIFISVCDDEILEHNGIYALEEFTGKTLWFARTPHCILTSPVYLNGMVFVMDNQGDIFAFDAANGAPLWENTAPHRFFAPRSNCQLLVYNGESPMIVGADRFHARAVNPNNGGLLWVDSTYPSISDGFNTRLIIGDKLVITSSWRRDDGQLFAIDLPSGKILWHTKIANFLMKSILTATPDGKVLLTSWSGSLLFNPDNGEVLTRDADNEMYNVISPAEFSQGKIFAGLRKQALCAFDPATLKLLWSAEPDFQVPDPCFADCVSYFLPEAGDILAKPVIVNGMLVTAAVNGYLFAHSTDGKLLAKTKAGMPLLTSPLLHNGHLYIVDAAGRLFVFEIQ